MFKKSVTVVALAALWMMTASAQDAKTVIANASKAMGVDRLKTVQYTATGSDFVLGQAPNPSAPWPRFINKSYSRATIVKDVLVLVWLVLGVYRHRNGADLYAPEKRVKKFRRVLKQEQYALFALHA